ncbi:hypothetical protein CDL15_Pgr023035 [Punica granatum]|nr:hypothetical protein CDL15_Pgr023035 [Punica granatum]
MHRSGMKLNETTFSTVLSICANSKSLKGGKEIHSLILRSGSERFELVGSALLYFYANCAGAQEAEWIFEEFIHMNDRLWNLMIVAYVQYDWMEDAMDVFERMPRRDVAAWTSLISGFAKQEDAGSQETALELFQLMRETGEVAPNEFTLDCILRTSCKLGVSRLGLAIHGLVIKYGLQSDDSISSALIEFYSSCEAINEARRVYDGAVNPSLNASNALLEGLVSMGRINDAEVIFNGLSELKPISYNLMIKGYGLNGQVKDSKRLFDKMPQRTIASFNTMIAVYSRNGEINKAMQLFDEIKGEGNPVSWNSMISGCIQNGHYEDAFKLYREGRELSITRTRSTFSALFHACSCLGSLKLGQMLHAHVLKTPHQSNVYVGTSLVDMYSRCGSIDDARRSFSSISLPNVAAWTALINAYAHHRLGSEAIRLFEEMLENGVCPNSATFVGILSACGHSGLIEEGMRIYRAMGNYGIIPTFEHYACVANLLGRSGYLKEAEEFIDQMPIKADGVVWGALLSACWFWADMEAAERVAEKMFRIDYNNVSAHVILSNIYALSGRWREKRKVRKQLRGLALKKDPGRSWIELNSGFHAFSVEDRGHPQCDLIYWTLERITANVNSLVMLDYVSERTDDIADVNTTVPL